MKIDNVVKNSIWYDPGESQQITGVISRPCRKNARRLSRELSRECDSEKPLHMEEAPVKENCYA